jgi:hypothetical protein
MTIKDMADLKNNATEQLTVDYAVWFSKDDATKILILVDKETPRVVNWGKVSGYILKPQCPMCDTRLERHAQYCHMCGQRLEKE